MQYIRTLLFLISFPAVGENLVADEVISFLLSESPTHDGVPLRDTEIKDLEGGGVEEILLLRNEIEENAVGYLNVELYEALVWIDIYKKTERGLCRC
ncbi:MAG: hypothetical protein Q7U82_07235 [Gammaproteobacteria bacterium]|nr:hypothetical protein [Gammaproteobacteria bacterium]MDO9318516.1 hypothetical protein [Gammaproteobacteria bacterium]